MPAAHAAQLEAPRLEAKVPAAQSVQSVPPVLYLPRPQSAQVTAPASELDLPAAHARHKIDDSVGENRPTGQSLHKVAPWSTWVVTPPPVSAGSLLA